MTSFLKTKSTLVFGEGDDVPAHHVHSSFLQGGTQIKFLWALSIREIILLRMKWYYITWIGILLREAFARVTLPKRFRNLVFQPASLVLMLLMMNWKSF